MNVQENLVQIFRACIPENFGAAYPPFWLFVPQGVRVPPVKNHCARELFCSSLQKTWPVP